MTGFEPATPRPPGVYATRLRHIPIHKSPAINLRIPGFSKTRIIPGSSLS